MIYPTLYSFRRCPYAMRARYALLYAGVQCLVHEVKLSDKPDSMLRLSPKGTVPVLHLPSGAVIDESLDIVNYALTQSDPKHMALVTEQQLVQFSQWVGAWQGEWVPAINAYKYNSRHTEKSREAAYKLLLDLLQTVEESLKKNGCLIHASPTTADIALFPLIRQFAIIDQAGFLALPFPYTIQWLQQFLDDHLFKAVMIKYRETEHLLL